MAEPLDVILASRPRSAAWRALIWFWAAVLALVAGGVGVLQWLGPPPPRAPRVAAGNPPAPPPMPPPPSAEGSAEPVVPPGTIAPPDPALLEPSAAFPDGMLPRIGPGGRAPMRVYAAPFNAPAARPRVALLLGGFGLSEADSEEAIRALPGAVSLAVSPYAYHPDRLLTDARAAGHELWLALPLEPARYPIDDPGNEALLTGNPDGVNRQRLEWALTRFAGYVGATGALNGMRGERFAAATDLMEPVLQTLAARGLMYVDPRPGAAHPPFVTGRSVDVVIDEPPVRTAIEANLARLEVLARDHGAALGLIGVPRPVTLDRVAAWATMVGARGFALAPVSALAEPPPPADATGSGGNR